MLVKLIFIAVCFVVLVLLNGIINEVNATEIITPKNTSNIDVEKEERVGKGGFNESRCQYDEFKCESGQCIHKLKVCDAFNDCKDGSDENDQTCRLTNTTTCPVIFTAELRVQCEFKGDSKNQEPCDIIKSKILHVRAWTTLKIRCNVGLVPADYARNDYTNLIQWNFTNICQDNGEWLYILPICIEVCGEKTTNEVKNELDISEKVNVTYYPWTAIIYRRKGDEYILHCLGTLISSQHVITDIACTRNSYGEDIPIEDFRIALGKVYKEFNSVDDEHPHYSNIAYIDSVHFIYVSKNSLDVIDRRTWTTYTHGKNIRKDYEDYSPTIVSFMMEKQALLHRFIRPVCHDLGGKLTKDIESPVGNVFVWLRTNFTSKKMLGELQISDISQKNCDGYLNSSELNDTKSQDASTQLCAYSKSGKTNSRIPRGAGLTYEVNGKHYFIGVATQSIILGEEKDHKVVNVFDSIYPFAYKFIKENEFMALLIDKKGRCVVPATIGTKYSASRCSDDKNCTSEIPTHTLRDKLSVMYLSCEENYTLANQCPLKVCIGAIWIPQNTACIRLCEPLESNPSLQMSCSYQGKNVSCSDKVVAGTIATWYCKISDISVDKIGYNSTCLPNGQWKDPPSSLEQNCVHKCGVIHSDVRVMQHDSDETNPIYHPWNAGVYRQWNNGKIEYICGGTLITMSAVLSAAHCVEKYEDGQIIRIYEKKLKIGLGKNYREYNHPKDESYSQLLGVKKIHKPNEYEGEPLLYIHDIAVFELKNKAVFSSFVLPACIDAIGRNVPDSDSLGVVTGWGLGSQHKESETLKEIELPFISRDECLDNFRLKDRKFLTIDKFCAFYSPHESNVTISDGMTGSGLIFEFEGVHYIYGVVSKPWNIINVFIDVTNKYNLDVIKKAVLN